MVAVVVPSPATSLVFWATALTSLAPMFSNGSGRSISLQTVTPSLVTVGPAEGLVDDDVAAGRPERDADRLGQLLGPGEELLAGVVGVEQLLRHVCVSR